MLPEPLKRATMIQQCLALVAREADHPAHDDVVVASGDALVHGTIEARQAALDQRRASIEIGRAHV